MCIGIHRDAQIERLEDQRRKLVRSHEKYINDLSMDYDRKLDDERQTRIQLEEERLEVVKEMTEVQVQLEDDLDTEIDNLRKGFEERLSTSRELTLKLKGENGIMRKKFTVVQREIEEQKVCVCVCIYFVLICM